MSSDLPHDYEKAPFPNILSTPERYMARMRATLMARTNTALYAKIRPTPEDFAAFADAYPDKGRIFERCKAQKNYIAMGTAIGTVGSMAYTARISSTKPYIAVAGFIGLFTSLFTAEHIGSWVSGVYKYDTVGLNYEFLKWVEQQRRPDPISSASSSSSSST